MKKATSFTQPMTFTGTYPSNWPGYTFLQPRTPEGHPELRHIGVDYNFGSGNQDIGMDVVCVANGIVEKCIPWNKLAGYGNHVFVRHELSAAMTKKYGTDIVYSHYAHLNDIVCTEGQEINKGDLIGHVGNTGTQYGHCHLEIRKPTGEGYESYPSAKPETWLRQYYFDPYLFIEENKTEEPDMASQLAECQLQVQQEIQNKNETYQELQEVKSDLEGAKAESDSAKKQYSDFVNELAVSLGIATDHNAIMGQIGKLIKEEEQLLASQKAQALAETQFKASQDELTTVQGKYNDLAVQSQEQINTIADQTNQIKDLTVKLKNGEMTLEQVKISSRSIVDDLEAKLATAQTASKLKIVGKILRYYIAVDQ